MKNLDNSADAPFNVVDDPATVHGPSPNPENQRPPETAVPARQTPPVIPTSAAANSTVAMMPAVAPAASSVPAPTPPPHAPTSTPTYAPESSTPAKRSRTPDLGEGMGVEKRQKTEHSVGQESIQTPTEVKIEDDAPLNGDGASDWNLESMLANALGAVNETDDSMNIDTTTTTAAPTRRRLEKMKFIESPTYFSRSMGLPLLGSLVSKDTFASSFP